MRWRASVGWTLAIAGLAALSVWAFRPQPVSVETRQVELADFEQTVDEEGRTRVRDRYVVAAPAAGRLERITLEAGDAVDAGAVIAVLRPTMPALRDARTIAELREQVGAATARKLAADAQVARARAALEQARFEAQRADRLADQGFASRAAQDDARLRLDQQTQVLRAAEFDQRATEHELALARATLAQGDAAARRPGAEARIEIRSPVRGRVLGVAQESEGAVALGTPLLEIGDAGSLEAVIDVLSQDALRIAPGMPVHLETSPAVAPLEGTVRRIEPRGRTKISTLGVEEQRVNVIVDFVAGPQMPAALGDGYRVEARIVVLARSGVPVVPVGALFRDGEHWAVFTVDGGAARRRRVELGARNQHSAWVTEGLRAGDTVIVYPPDAVREGARVRTR